MQKGEWVFRSAFAKKYIAIGRKEGREEGREEGAEAAKAAKAEDVLAVLDARGIAVTDDVAVRVRACGEVALLDKWIRRAATIDRAEALFADDAVKPAPPSRPRRRARG